MFESHLYGIETVSRVESFIKSKGLNRTFMELKLLLRYSVTLWPQRLNRTFMELKRWRIEV